MKSLFDFLELYRSIFYKDALQKLLNFGNLFTKVAVLIFVGTELRIYRAGIRPFSVA